MKRTLLLNCLVLFASAASAQVRLPAAYGSHLVLTPQGVAHVNADAQKVAVAVQAAKSVNGGTTSASLWGAWAQKLVWSVFDPISGLYDGVVGSDSSPGASFSDDTGLMAPGCTEGSNGSFTREVICYVGSYDTGTGFDTKTWVYSQDDSTPFHEVTEFGSIPAGDTIVGEKYIYDMGSTLSNHPIQKTIVYVGLNLRAAAPPDSSQATPPDSTWVGGSIAAYTAINTALSTIGTAGPCAASTGGCPLPGSGTTAGSFPPPPAVGANIVGGAPAGIVSQLAAAKSILEMGTQLVPGDFAVVGAPASTTTATTGSGVPAGAAGTAADPMHVVVDNTVTVKYTGDDNTLPTALAVSTYTRSQTFAGKWAAISAGRSTPPVLSLLGNLAWPGVDTSAFSTIFCFDSARWGHQCVDVASYGFWTVVTMVHFFVIAAALFESYAIIFG